MVSVSLGLREVTGSMPVFSTVCYMVGVINKLVYKDHSKVTGLLSILIDWYGKVSNTVKWNNCFSKCVIVKSVFVCLSVCQSVFHFSSCLPEW